MYESAVVGEAVAGDSAKTRAVLENLIQNIDKQVFDVAELLHKVQSNMLYVPEFNTYKEYTRSLKIKNSRAEYLPKIVKVMTQVGIKREVYEKLGIGRLREITSLDPTVTWVNPDTKAETPMTEFIIGFVEKGEEIEMDDLKQHVRTLKGFIGENDIAWLNLPFTRSTMENTVRPGIEKMKALIGSVKKDDDGVSQDASDSRAVELAFAEILSDDTLSGQDFIGEESTNETE